MTLRRLVEPLFQYLCRLNRAGRMGAITDYEATRRDLDELFEQMRKQSLQDPVLQQQYREMELPLFFFVDFMIAYSDLPFASQWRKDENRLAYSVGERGGDQKFLDLVDAALSPGSTASPEQLAIYYTCLGLGFSGQPPLSATELQQKMLQLSSRLRGVVDSDLQNRLVPESYYSDTTPYNRPPGGTFARIGIVLAGLILVLLAANVVLWRESVADFRRAILAVIDRGPAATAVEPPTEQATDETDETDN